METFSPNYLATNFGIDRQTVTRVLRDVAPTREKTKGRPTFSLETFSKAWDEHRLRNSSPNAGEDGASHAANLTAARTRIAVANAERIELTNAIARGEYASIETVRDALIPAFLSIREIALSLPGTIADALTPHCDETRGKIVDIVRDKVIENLENLATTDAYIEAASLDLPPSADDNEGDANE
jgi:phage terminase Nu1 subunit (DNA packaging protein)